MTTPRVPRTAFIASLVGSLIALTLGLVAAPAASSATIPAYMAVIDAGSSGTRLALFEQGAGVTVTRVYRAETNTPGLSSYADKPADAGPGSVQPLLDQLRGYLDGKGIAVADVPVALLATAGMRRLKLNDPVATRQIFASTKATLDASGFPVLANKILPDFQEALLAWLDANARAGTLDTPRQDIGIIEVGGASAQVAFRSPRTTGTGVSTVRVSGQEIGVVAISYLGLGANEARGFMQQARSGGDICFPNNASGTDPEAYLANSDMPVPSAEANFLPTPCGRAYTRVIREVGRAYPRDLRPANLDQLPGFARATFVGLGAIPYTYADLQVDPAADDREGLRSALNSDCKGPDAWATVRELIPDPPAFGQPSFAETLCSSGSYLDSFFFGPYGVGLDPARFDAQPDLPGGEPSWSEGYAITVLHP